MILWLDLETTGLDPRTDEILEAGLTLTTDDLTIINSCSYTVKPTWWPGVTDYGLRDLRKRLDPVVYDMHVSSGLFTEVDRFGLPLRSAENALTHWLIDNQAQQLPTAGSTVSFDRSFTKEHMPALDSMFHYRRIDISTLKELARVWKPGVMVERNFNAQHRVLSDIADSIAELAHYKKGLLAL